MFLVLGCKSEVGDVYQLSEPSKLVSLPLRGRVIRARWDQLGLMGQPGREKGKEAL